MSEFGYVYTPAPYQHQPEVDFNFLYPESGEVAANGYAWQLARRSAALDGGSGGPSPEQLADPDYARVLDDVCGPRGSEAVGWAEFSQLRERLSSIQDENAMLLESDERVIAVAQEWSDCMNDLGYDFQMPQDAIGHAESLPGGLAGPDAIVVAVHDYNCRHLVSYAETRRLVREELNAAWLEQNPTVLADLSDSLSSVRDRARAILGR